jgi:hypothetical protein
VCAITDFVEAVALDDSTKNVSDYFSTLAEKISSPAEYFEAVTALVHTWYSVHTAKHDAYHMAIDTKLAFIASNFWNVDVFDMVSDSIRTKH